MRDRKTTIIFLIVVTVIVSAMLFLNIYVSRIPENPSGTTGNTAGNLNNNGLYCEDEGIVYFANPYDNGALYSMNVDETDMKKNRRCRSSVSERRWKVSLLLPGFFLCPFRTWCRPKHVRCLSCYKNWK